MHKGEVFMRFLKIFVGRVQGAADIFWLGYTFLGVIAFLVTSFLKILKGGSTFNFSPCVFTMNTVQGNPLSGGKVKTIMTKKSRVSLPPTPFIRDP